MPNLSQHQSNEYTKMLLEGDSGSGKTGSLASLVGAGYALRILDMDNGLDALKQFVMRDCPERISNVEYRTLRDQRKATAEGFEVVGAPTAFRQAVRMLDRWKYTNDDGSETDLGNPAEWGPGVVLVIDTLTFLSDAAYDYRLALAKGLGNNRFDARAVYKDAQDAIEGVLAGITSPNFRTNVIVTSHIKYIDRADGTKKGYPTSIGSALSPVIPRYFNTVALCQTKAGGKRTIKTVATAEIDLKNPKPFDTAAEYDISDGLGKFFQALRNAPSEARSSTDRPTSQPISQPMPKPTSVRLQRR